MISILLQLATLQSFILFVFFLVSRPRKQSNIILAVFAFTVAALCFFQGVESVAFYVEFPHLIRINWGLLLLLWPLIFLFVRAFLSGPFSGGVMIHFVPYIINLIILSPFLFQSAESKIQILNHYTPFITQGFSGYADYFMVLSIVVGAQSLVYSFKIFKEVNKHRHLISEMYSSENGASAKWFLTIAYGMIALSILYGTTLFLNLNNSYIDQDHHQFFYLGLFILILLLSYRSVYQPASVVSSVSVELPDNTTVDKRVIASPGFSEELMTRLGSKLIRLFETDKIHTQQDLNALEVAKQLNTSRQNLSQVLSSQFKMNFYDFVNGYRVREFQSRLASGKYTHLTLLGLALECGFNSKSSFNSLFKKATGMTPSAYAASKKK